MIRIKKARAVTSGRVQMPSAAASTSTITAPPGVAVMADEEGKDKPPIESDPGRPEPEQQKQEQPEPEEKWAEDNLTEEDRRRQLRELRKIRAATFGPGSSAFGRDQHQYFGDAHFHQSGTGNRWRTGPFDDASRRRLRDQVVRPPSQDELDALVVASTS